MFGLHFTDADAFELLTQVKSEEQAHLDSIGVHTVKSRTVLSGDPRGGNGMLKHVSGDFGLRR